MASEKIQTHFQSKLTHSGIFFSLISSDIAELISLQLECSDDKLYIYSLYATSFSLLLTIIFVLSEIYFENCCNRNFKYQRVEKDDHGFVEEPVKYEINRQCLGFFATLGFLIAIMNMVSVALAAVRINKQKTIKLSSPNQTPN